MAWLNVYISWATVRGHSQDIHTLPPVELNKVLKQFFGEIRKKDGKEYEPDCLRVMLGALHRHLTSVNYPGDLITGREFKDCRDVLEGKCCELRANGMGRRPNAANSLSRVEEEQLWEYGRLGANNPTSLLYTYWWNLTQHLGLTLFTIGGAIWPPSGQIARELKIGPGRRPGLLALLIQFSYACFLKKLGHFHGLVKSYAGFVRDR